MRPVLRPGTHVLRRGPDELQVGLDPASALVLPDSPEVRTSLGRLATGAEEGSYDDRGVLDLLGSHHQLVDQGSLVPLAGPDPVPSPAGAALARDSGAGSRHARDARRRWRTRTVGFGHPGGVDLRDRFVALAASAGLREAAPRSDADGGVLLGVGEPDRSLLDGWARAGTPHLVVRLTEGVARVGPFVAPGATACLRCLDAHCTDADPAWPLLIAQYSRASARDRPDGTPEPLDPLLAAVALSWAARDLATYVDGGRPSTWSATVVLDARLAAVETRSWLRHPGCACTWE